MKKKRKAIITFLAAFIVLASTMPVNAATANGTSKVWAGVPLIGSVYVCTPWTATYKVTSVVNDTKQISNVTTGVSYTSAGIALVTYEAYDSWSEITSPSGFDVYARGHCDFVFKGCPVSMGLQTFLAHESL